MKKRFNPNLTFKLPQAAFKQFGIKHRLYMLVLVFFFMFCGKAIPNNMDSAFVFQTSILVIDSLKKMSMIPTLPEKQIANIYFQIAREYHAFELDSSLAYAKKGIVLAQATNDEELLMDLYSAIGISSSFKGDYDAAFVGLEKMTALAIKLGNKKQEANAQAFLGFSFAKQGKFYAAIDYYLKFLKICEKEGWITGCLASFCNLGEICRRLGNMETAIQYLKQAEEICKTFEENDNQIFRWNMPQIYNEYAFIYLKQGDYDEALRYANTADSISLPIGTVNLCYTKGVLASIYLKLNDYDQALLFAKEAYNQANILKDVSLYSHAGQILSDVYLAQQRYQEAEAEALKVWYIDSTHIEESRAIAKNIALANIHLGNMEKASYFLNKYADMSELYSETSFHNTVSDMNIKYATAKKEELIATLEKERKLYVWLVIAGGLLLITLLIMMLLMSRNARKEQQLIASKAVQDGEMNERTRLAADLHDRLGGFLSALKMEIRNTENMGAIGDKLELCINAIHEINHNLMPRSLKKSGLKAALEDFASQFPNVHFYFFGEERHIRDRQKYAIYCCANELVTNAIKHSGAANINMQIVQDKKYISLTVQDDGCGFDEKTVKKGLGLQSIRNRITSCNGKLDTASAAGKGTETTIELKIEN